MLDELDKLQPTTLTGRLKPLWPTIDRKLNEGVKAKKIIQTLKENGLDIKERVFYTYLYRYREDKKSRPDEVPSNGIALESSPDNPTEGKIESISVNNKSDLKNLRNQEIDLDELEKIGRESK